MRIITKLLISYVLIIPLVALIGFYTIAFSESILEREIGEHSHETISHILENIDKLAFFHITQSRTISSVQILQEALLSSNQEFAKMDDVDSFVIQTDKEWTSVPKEEISPFMHDLMNNNVSDFLKGVSDSYKQEYGYPVYAEIFVTNAYGANVAQTGKTSDYKQDDERWWHQAKQNGLFVNDVEYDESAGVYSVDIAIRIDNKDGNFLGIMKNVVNVKDLIEIINDAKNQSKFHVEYEWVTSDHKLIYSTEKFHVVSEDMFSDMPSEKIFEGSENYFVSFGDKVSKEQDHNEYLYAWAQSDGYRDFTGFDWIMISEYRTDEIFRSISELKFFFPVISVAVFVAIAVMGVMISRSIVLPINMLRKTTKDITEGRYDTKTLIKGDEDIQRLADDVNIMKQRIKEQFEEIKLHNIQRNEFLTMITHELKTPLVPIQGYADLLLSEHLDSLTDMQKERVSMIRSSATSLLNIISDLLDTQKLELGQLKMKKENSLIKDTLEKAVRIMQPAADKKEVKVTNTTSEQSSTAAITVPHDPERIVQVMTNLLKNALRAVKEKEGVIQINIEDHPYEIRISVKDNGLGIPGDKQRNLFQKFYQVNTSLTRDVGGSGLGLSICKGIVETSGGRIWVESYAGKGTTFYFSLPKCD